MISYGWIEESRPDRAADGGKDLKAIGTVALLALCASSAVALADERLDAVTSAIRALDDEAVVYVAFQAHCEKAMEGEARTLWSMHRDFGIATYTDMYNSRDKALIRYDEVFKAAKGIDREPYDDVGFCISALDQMKHATDVAAAKLAESYSN
ncbi:hypothetical protein [Rhodobacter sp. 24-YEA-8]|uniref:hypothetical protein n=1 Tax=Rhodobacter sp. 24-YEA-8 TaxID=1884310 RepID=UPI000899E605|nr:hypothetical protein [Rhodobacter sp. 24-YEA-8]SEB79497.1 hypothetical protein SAMN05519105_1324 [Rhodobacter sp. 24-YEA-8]